MAPAEDPANPAPACQRAMIASRMGVPVSAFIRQVGQPVADAQDRRVEGKTKRQEHDPQRRRIHDPAQCGPAEEGNQTMHGGSRDMLLPVRSGCRHTQTRAHRTQASNQTGAEPGSTEGENRGGTGHGEDAQDQRWADEMGRGHLVARDPGSDADGHENSECGHRIHYELSIEATVRGTGLPRATISLAAKTLPAAPPPGRIRLSENAPIATLTECRRFRVPPGPARRRNRHWRG